jgi:hypothetical protein
MLGELKQRGECYLHWGRLHGRRSGVKRLRLQQSEASLPSS